MTPEAKEFPRQILLSPELITARLDQLAQEISQKYPGQRLLLVGVLRGAFILTADLCRALYRAGLTDIEIDFVEITSYADKTESSRNPRLIKDVETDVTGRHILLVEDIVDTGYSLAALQALLSVRGIASLETFVLLSKPKRREIAVPVEYVGFEVSDWVEGYGLDTDQFGRANPAVVKVIV